MATPKTSLAPAQVHGSHHQVALSSCQTVSATRCMMVKQIHYYSVVRSTSILKSSEITDLTAYCIASSYCIATRYCITTQIVQLPFLSAKAQPRRGGSCRGRMWRTQTTFLWRPACRAAIPSTSSWISHTRSPPKKNDDGLYQTAKANRYKQYKWISESKYIYTWTNSTSCRLA